MKKTLLTLTLVVSALTVGVSANHSPAWSQSQAGLENINLGQARNSARQAIESLNGGLQQYRAEASMHGPVCLAPFTENEDGTLTFTFFGGPPGAPFTTESVVTVADGDVAEVLYNGPIRSGNEVDRSAPSTLGKDAAVTDACLNRISLIGAKNLARQAAEAENGGLSQYRAEASMHGPAADAPFVENEDGSLTFTFRGRRPENLEFTIESVVTVTPGGDAIVEYNGAVR
ncbi:MAG: purine nucleoside permease [Cyanobacteria bacterium J06626_18]